MNWKDAEQAERLKANNDRYFQKCFVEDAILEGRARIGYAYKEEPEASETSEDPDSGWRIRADQGQISAEEYENPNVSYVAVGLVLDQDDSLLTIIDAPVGSAFERNETKDDYSQVD